MTEPVARGPDLAARRPDVAEPVARRPHNVAESVTRRPDLAALGVSAPRVPSEESGRVPSEESGREDREASGDGVRLVLASASPARRATLVAAGVDPEVIVSSVDEAAVLAAAQEEPRAATLLPPDVALLLARAKAEDVAARLPREAVVLGCDSVFELDGAVYGKPSDAADAAARWRSMSGRTGLLHTGHWLLHEGGEVGATASTYVRFASVTDDEVRAYVATGEPLACAGAFTIDGYGGAFVEEVRGDPHNVVGVSLPLLRRLLQQLGIRWIDLWRPSLRPPALSPRDG